MNYKKIMSMCLLTIVPFFNIEQVSYAIKFEDKDKAREWGKNKYEKLLHEKLTNIEKKAINDYTIGDYSVVNKYLISTKGKFIKDYKFLPPEYETNKVNIEEIIEKIKCLDHAIKKFNIDEEIFVYRHIFTRQFGNLALGLRVDRKINEKIVKKIEDTYLDKIMVSHNFLSTSLVQNLDVFEKKDYPYPIIMKIKIPKGINGVYISSISNFSEELEMLINRDYGLRYDQFFIVKNGAWEVLKINVSLIKHHH